METMLLNIEAWIRAVGALVDMAGVAVIVGGLLWFTIWLARQWNQAADADRYKAFKMRVGRVLLLGLEILVAAEIIKTVALDPSFTSVGVLALLVLIHTFLSWTLVLEIEDRWLWQRPKEA